MSYHLTRRELMQFMVGGSLALTALPLLSACGDDEEEPTATDTDDSTPTEDAETETETGTAEETEEPTDEATEETEEPTDEATEETTPEVTSEPTAETTEEQDDEVETGSLTVYSGRNENLVGPIIERFREETGIDVQVRYGDTAELAAAILEEGQNSPADIYYGQDAGALGALAGEGRLQVLPEDILGLVDDRFKSPDGEWVGITGRARVIVYNTDAVDPSEFPESILDFTAPEWEGRLGWAPTNGSFQSFVTALRELEGDDVARNWLEGIRDNDARVYENNTSIVNAAIDGEIDAGFVNHYYLYRMRAEAGSDLGADNYFYEDGDAGALINVSGAGMLDVAQNTDEALMFIEYMLSNEAQEYFVEETFEYPTVEGIEPNEAVPSIDELQTPELDLSDLDDLEGTLEMLTEVGLI